LMDWGAVTIIGGMLFVAVVAIRRAASAGASVAA
jgi:hypothetical protein